MTVSHDILSGASKHGAEALTLACPLCDYNLGKKQDLMLGKFEGMKEMPIYYFTQLLAVALGVGENELHLDLNRDSSTALLRDKNLLKAAG
jgi:heterodisulfide reductase subunit B